MSISNPLTFNLLEHFRPKLCESHKALWVYFIELFKKKGKAISVEQQRKIYFASTGLPKTSRIMKFLLNSEPQMPMSTLKSINTVSENPAHT